MGRRKTPEANDEYLDDGVEPSADAETVLVNSDLTEEEKQALFLQGVAEIERHQAKKKELVNPIDAAIKTARKRMKAEGFTKSDVDDALRLRQMDPEQVVAEHESFLKVAKWCGHTIGYQADLFAHAKDRTPLIERAEADGRVAGMRGDDCKVPDKYSEASDAGQGFLRGWHAGQAVLLNAIAKRKPDQIETEEGGGMPGADAEGA